MNLVEATDDTASNIQNSVGKRDIAEQERSILRATVLLLLYNLMEATCRSLLKELNEDIKEQNLSYKKVSEEVKKAWIISAWGSRPANERLSAINKIEEMITFSHSSSGIEIETKALMESLSGNVSIQVIKEIGEKYGFDAMPRTTLREGAELERVKNQRNSLGHGNKSFVECGRDFPPNALKLIRIAVVDTFSDVLTNIETFVASKGYEEKKRSKFTSRVPKGNP